MLRDISWAHCAALLLTNDEQPQSSQIAHVHVHVVLQRT